MDALDLKIIDVMVKDAQTPFTKIAETVGTTNETVRKRYERLKESGFILNSTISIDLQKLGYSGFIIIFIKSLNTNRAKSAIRRISNIINISLIVGEHDIMVWAICKNFGELMGLVNKIELLDYVSSTEIMICKMPPSFPHGTLLRRMVSINFLNNSDE